jgi:hypothetical protein
MGFPTDLVEIEARVGLILRDQIFFGCFRGRERVEVGEDVSPATPRCNIPSHPRLGHATQPQLL